MKTPSQKREAMKRMKNLINQFVETREKVDKEQTERIEMLEKGMDPEKLMEKHLRDYHEVPKAKAKK